MIRRWSHIKQFNMSLDTDCSSKNFFFFRKAAKINIFKSSVSTRRFNKKYTKFRRKAFNRLKHKTNWLIYTNVFKFWSQDYLSNKYVAKSQFLSGLFIDNFFFINFNFAKNKNPEIFSNWNFSFLNLVTLSRKPNLLFSETYFSKRNKTKSNSLALAWRNEPTEFGNLAIPVFSSWDNVRYSHDYFLSSSPVALDLNLVFETIADLNYQKLLLFYKISLLLTLSSL